MAQILEVTSRSCAMISDEPWDSVVITTNLGDDAARRLAIFELGVLEPLIHLVHDVTYDNGKPKKEIRRYTFRARL